MTGEYFKHVRVMFEGAKASVKDSRQDAEMLDLLGITEERYLELLGQWMRNEDAFFRATLRGESVPYNPGLIEFMMRECGKSY